MNPPLRSVAIAAVLASAAPAYAQHGAIDCTPGGHGVNCQVQLRENQQFATIRFRPSVPILGTNHVVFLVSGATGITRDTVQTDARQIATLTWAGSPPQEPVRILVQSSAAGVIQTDTISILPVPEKDRVRTERYAPYVWLSNSWMPLTIRPQVVSATSEPMNEERCERVRFAVRPWAGSEVKPDSGLARWEGAGGCVAATRWKLGDAGPHQIRLVLGDGERVVLSDEILHANARQAPRIVGGVAIFTRFNARPSYYCQSYEQTRTECVREQTRADTIKREFDEEKKNTARTFFGLEAPVIYQNQPVNPVSRFINKRVRVLVGSTFEQPKDNLFLGLTAIPLLAPAYEQVPVQLQGGWRPLEGGFFVGGSIDGSGLVTGALKALGATL